MKFQRFLISAVLCSSLLFLSSTGQAEEKAKTISEKEIIRAESLGTLAGARDRALPRSAWKNTKRSMLMNALDAISPESPSPVIFDLKKKILLSEINASEIENDVKPDAENNLLIKRLQKLNDMGAFEDSLALYAKLKSPFGTTIARQGMTAMLGSMKASLACLELKVLDKETFGPFEKELDVFCTHLLETDQNTDDTAKKENADKRETEKDTYPLLNKLFSDSVFIYTPDDFDQFNKKSLIKKIALLSQDKVDFSKLEKANIQAVSSQTLSLLLSYDKLPDRLRLPLAIKAARTGLKPYSIVEDTYNALAQNAVDEVTIHGTEDSLKEWQILPFIYARLNAKENKPSEEEILTKLTKAIQQSKTYGTESLYPFAPSFTEKRLNALFGAASDDEKKSIRKTLISAFILLNETDTQKWRTLLGDSPAPFPLLLSRFLNTHIAESIFGENTEKEIREAFLDIPKKTGKHLFFLASVLDKKILFIHNPIPIYEKQIGLTIQGNYVMPSVGLNDALSQAVENKQMGEIVLLNLLVLQHAHPDHLYPGLLDSVLENLENVGLNRETQELKKETFLALSKKIEGE